MPELTQQPREDLRHAVRKFLARTFPLAFAPEALGELIARRGWLAFRPTVDNLATACSMLAEMGHLEELPDDLGASRTYKATAKGIIEYERNG
jgi:hypothetical protein